MTMIERVKQAIIDVHDRDAASPYERIGDAMAEELARAAIEAMRRTTPRDTTGKNRVPGPNIGPP